MQPARYTRYQREYLGWGVFDLDGCSVGMGLCNDRRWPETYRMLSLQSAELAVFGYNTPSVNPNHHQEPHLPMFHHLLSLQAGAYQNSLWVAAAAKCGSEDGNHMIGGSAVVAPSGEIVARSLTEDDEVVSARVDLDMGQHFRDHIFNFGAHRRPETYGLIVERTGRAAARHARSRDQFSSLVRRRSSPVRATVQLAFGARPVLEMRSFIPGTRVCAGLVGERESGLST